VKLATFNINNINKRLDNLLAWLAKAEPDVVSLQELKAEQGAFPVNALRTLGYEAVWQGERSWNGVAILARHHVPVLTCTSLPGNPEGIIARGSRHPFDKLRASSERSRSSGGAKDLPLRHCVPREIPRPAGKKRGLFGMTPGDSEDRNHQDQHSEDQQARYIEAAVQGVLITSIYLPNGNPHPGPKFNYKLAWFERLIAHAAKLMASGAPVVLAGDYNVVPTPQDIYPTRSLDGNALIQPKSREAFARLLAQGWTDAMRKLHPDRPLWTFWDYKFERWQKDKGMRLDHFLLSPNLSARLVDGGVDRWARGQENASDHAPTWIVLDL
jgi:exodeoxyribonuclease-3